MGHRIAHITFEDLRKWDGHVANIKGLFTNCTDSFTCYNAPSHELPSCDELDNTDALLLTGSHYSAHDDSLPWLPKAQATLRSAALKARSTGRPKIFALCFGCQLLARALTGRVGPNPSNAFVAKVEHLRMRNDSLSQLPATQHAQRLFPHPVDHSTGMLCDIRLLESHGDQILELGDECDWFAESDTAAYEGFMYGKSVVALQGHPDLSILELSNIIIEPLMQKGRIPPEEAREEHARALREPNSSLFFIALIRSFLHFDDTSETADDVIAAVKKKEACLREAQGGQLPETPKGLESP